MTPAPFFMWQSAHRPFPVPTNLVFMSCNDFEKSPSTATPSTSQATTLTGSKKRKRITHTDELRAYLAERDEKCLTVIQEMQEKQNTLMEKLIEKL